MRAYKGSREEARDRGVCEARGEEEMVGVLRGWFEGGQEGWGGIGAGMGGVMEGGEGMGMWTPRGTPDVPRIVVSQDGEGEVGGVGGVECVSEGYGAFGPFRFAIRG